MVVNVAEIDTDRYNPGTSNKAPDKYLVMAVFIFYKRLKRRIYRVPRNPLLTREKHGITKLVGIHHKSIFSFYG